MDLAIDVLRSMPGSFLSTFSSLPQALKPVAALAEHPGLAAACLLSTEGSGGADRDLPTLTLCVDTRIMHDADGGATRLLSSSSNIEQASAHSMSKTDIWHMCDDEAANDLSARDVSQFSAEHRASTVSCSLHVMQRTLLGLQLDLHDSACLVLGPTSDGMELQNCCLLYTSPSPRD